MADMEEKVQYQSDERLRDVHEVLENCQTRVKLKVKQVQLILIILFTPCRSKKWNIYLSNSSQLRELTIQMLVL